MFEEEVVYPKPKAKRLESRRWRVTYTYHSGSTTLSYFKTYLGARLDIWMACSGNDSLVKRATILDQKPERPML